MSNNMKAIHILRMAPPVIRIDHGLVLKLPHRSPRSLVADSNESFLSRGCVGLERRQRRVAGLERPEGKAGAQALGVCGAAVRVEAQALGQEQRDNRQPRQAEDEQ
jgi:hypothetical protein